MVQHLWNAVTSMLLMELGKQWAFLCWLKCPLSVLPLHWLLQISSLTEEFLVVTLICLSCNFESDFWMISNDLAVIPLFKKKQSAKCRLSVGVKVIPPASLQWWPPLSLPLLFFCCVLSLHDRGDAQSAITTIWNPAGIHLVIHDLWDWKQRSYLSPEVKESKMSRRARK